MNAAGRPAQRGATPWAMRCRVAAARAHQMLGWPGLLGGAMLAMALCWMAMAWHAHHAPLPAAESPMPVAPSTAIGKAGSTEPLSLPDATELPLLITQVQQAAVANGLAWSAADYKVTAATAGALSTLEIRCNLHGAYPPLRRTIAQWLREVPGLALRDFTVSRAGPDTAEVDAKLKLVVFLRAVEPAAAASRPSLPQGAQP